MGYSIKTQRIINSILKEKGKRAVVTRSISCSCLGLSKKTVYSDGMVHANRKITLERAIAKVVYTMKNIKVIWSQIGADNKLVHISDVSVVVIDNYLYLYAHCLGYVIRLKIPKETYKDSVAIVSSIQQSGVFDTTVKAIMGYEIYEMGSDRGVSGSGIKYINYDFTSGKTTLVKIRAHEFHWLLAHPEHIEYIIQHDRFDTNHVQEAPNGDYVKHREYNSVWNLELTLKFLNNMVGRMVDKLILDGKTPRMSIHEISMPVKEFCKHAGVNYNGVLLHPTGELLDRETNLEIIPKELICNLYYVR